MKPYDYGKKAALEKLAVSPEWIEKMLSRPSVEALTHSSSGFERLSKALENSVERQNRMYDKFRYTTNSPYRTDNLVNIANNQHTTSKRLNNLATDAIKNDTSFYDALGGQSHSPPPSPTPADVPQGQGISRNQALGLGAGAIGVAGAAGGYGAKKYHDSQQSPFERLKGKLGF